MENQQLANVNNNSAINHIKIMNKLGASFFIIFLVGAILPLIDLSGFSKETMSLYNLAKPTFLMVLAVIGVIVYLSGISKIAGRAVSFVFVALILVPLLSQLYDIYDVAKSAADIRENNFGGAGFEFRDILSQLEKSLKSIHVARVKDAISLASVLLFVSFIGIIGGIFSPRYKENKQLKAAITGQQVELTESDTSTQTKKNNANTGALLAQTKKLLATVITKLINIAKDAYQIVKPLINSLLDKGTDIICKQQPQLKREHVKRVLGGILVVLLYFIIF